MPHHKQTKKRLRKSFEQRAANRKARSEMRTLIKRVRTAADNDTPQEELEQALRRAQSIIDRMVKRGIVKRGTAQRTKSRLTQQVNKATSTSA